MLTPICPPHFVRRTLALSAILGASFAVMSAQTPAATEQPAAQPAATATASQPASAQALDLQLPAGSSSSDAALSTSSSADNEMATNVAPLNFIDAMQYGGRQNYNRPRYRGGNTNPDGSNKWMFLAGAGFVQPVGNTYHYLTPSYSFQVGGGRQFSKHFAIPLQFDWDNFGFNGRTISQQIYIYDTLTGGPNFDGLLDGHSHVWSFTLDPTYNIYSGEGLGAYVVGGVGFYHKVANFTVPEVVQGYDEFGYPVEYEANEPIDSYVSNAPGFNGGFGLTYKFSHFNSERLYGEVRYVVILNSQRQGYTDSNIATAGPTATNFYPANSNRTTYIPIKFGIRF